MWDLPRPGLEPVSPALAGGFLTTAPPGKPHTFYLLTHPLVDIWVVSTTMNNAAMNIYVEVFVRTYVFTSWIDI